MKKDHRIAIQLDPKRPLNRVGAMNNLAEVVRVLHFDEKVGFLDIKIGEKIHSFRLV